MPHRIHLIGSIARASAAEAFESFGRTLGARAPRVPDGETDRSWMAWLGHALERHAAFEVDDEEVPGRPRYGHKRYKLKPGVDPAALSFDTLRHAEVAQASYREFKHQKEKGVLANDAKFLFPIATPACFCSGQLREADHTAVEPAYERALFREIEKIAAAIPPHELAIQWDAPVETWPIERGTPTRFGATRDQMKAAVIERLIRDGNAVPEGVDLIYHFCYGDPGHKHIVEPSDTRIMVDLANGIAAGIKRSVELYHMPVPRQRDDDAYFAPLADLDIAAESDVCLGLVHHTDGVEGTRRRMATANRHVGAAWRDYWIATECGMGRRAPETMDRLLAIHAEVADLP